MTYPTQELKQIYKKTFDDLVPFITLSNRLKKEYGEEKAQLIMAKLSVPASVPFLAKVFRPDPKITDIDSFRQKLSDYLGSGQGFDWKEEVSEDKQEVRYIFTRCMYIEIMKAYGMEHAASMTCYCDHIIFDNVMPELYFKRDHCKGVGDTFCDHHYKIRTKEDAIADDQRYGDTQKAPYDAKAIIK